jgi:hypothetical protein
MLKLKKILPKEKIDPIDLQNRAAILEAKLLYTTMTPEDTDDAEGEISRITAFLGTPDRVPA